MKGMVIILFVCLCISKFSGKLKKHWSFKWACRHETRKIINETLFLKPFYYKFMTISISHDYCFPTSGDKWTHQNITDPVSMLLQAKLYFEPSGIEVVVATTSSTGSQSFSSSTYIFHVICCARDSSMFNFIHIEVLDSFFARCYYTLRGKVLCTQQKLRCKTYKVINV